MSKFDLVKLAVKQLYDDLDAGNSKLSEDQCTDLLDSISLITNPRAKLSKYQACNYLDMPRSTFDLHVKTGKLPKGRKQQGFKEIFWYKEDLQKYKNS